MPIHIVKSGEYLSKIAWDYGFTEKRLLACPENGKLKQLRPDVNVLHPGDEVYIPERRKKSVACATGNLYKFVVEKPQKVLRINVRNERRQPVGNAPFVLEVGHVKVEKTTNGDGLLEAPIPGDATTARLRIQNHEWQIRIGDLNPIEDTPDDGVSGIQARLANLGYDVGSIDGIIGPRMRRAIRAFQRDIRLKKTGNLDDETLVRLKQRHGS